MENKTIRWATNLLLCVGTGFMVSGLTVAATGNLDDKKVMLQAAGMLLFSVFVVLASYLFAMEEVE